MHKHFYNLKQYINVDESCKTKLEYHVEGEIVFQSLHQSQVIFISQLVNRRIKKKNKEFDLIRHLEEHQEKSTENTFKL